jgi:hypothetical protein
MGKVSLRDYKTSAFINLDDVEGGPIRKEIAGLVDGKYDKPDLVFTDGTRLSLNATNRKVLQKTYGTEEDDLIAATVELYAGEFDFQKTKKPGVAVRPITPTEKPSLRGDGDPDDIDEITI